MENKNVGWLIIGISVLIVFIIFLFNNAMKEIIMTGCPLAHGGTSCPAYATITQQTYLSLAIVGVLVIIGIFLIVSKPNEKIIIKKVRENGKKRLLNMNDLTKEEKSVLRLVQKEGTIFQSEIIDKTGFGKAKVTRIIDRLEGRNIVERKRRGMTNVVVLKS
jgi:uncharacterized membrane protein